MNLPNKLTVLRILLVPVCLLLLYSGQLVWSAAVFAIASITDFLDGKIARKNKLVTNFGKFADPIADKVLTVTMMICLSYLKMVPVWLPVIVVIRELMVDGLRLIAMEKGRVVAAGWSGKVKTVMQMVTILCALLLPYPVLITVLSGIVCALTVFSGVQYFWMLRDLFKGDFSK
jgi:CDP-diacylglycerol---glycerol-3-phosphate 3-phosphatidyltransferase